MRTVSMEESAGGVVVTVDGVCVSNGRNLHPDRWREELDICLDQCKAPLVSLKLRPKTIPKSISVGDMEEIVMLRDEALSYDIAIKRKQAVEIAQARVDRTESNIISAREAAALISPMIEGHPQDAKQLAFKVICNAAMGGRLVFMPSPGSMGFEKAKEFFGDDAAKYVLDELPIGIHRAYTTIQTLNDWVDVTHPFCATPFSKRRQMYR